MRHSIKSAFAIALAVAGWGNSASAQAVLPGESVDPYASVRGWDVYVVNSGSGIDGCRAVKRADIGNLYLEYYIDTWRVGTHTRQTSRFGGAILSIDKADIDTQFGFDNGYAFKDLTPDLLDRIRNGNTLGIEIVDDQNPLGFELSGSAATLLKLQECAQYYGLY